MSARRQLVRVLDANINRAQEALRVCEDVVRLGLSSSGPFRRLRALRHALGDAVRRLPVSPLERLHARDTLRDPGRRARPASVASLEQLLLINFQRTKEALRVLEESSRLVAPRYVTSFQQLRFRTYDVERSLLIHVATIRHRRPVRRARP